MDSNTSALSGIWLRQQRQTQGIDLVTISQAVRQTPKLIERVERWDLRIPPSWLPALAQIGLSVPGHPSPVASARTPSAPQPEVPEQPTVSERQEQPPPASTSAVEPSAVAPVEASQPPVAPADLTTEPAAPTQDAGTEPITLSGSWFRLERERLGISRSQIRVALNVKYSSVVLHEQHSRVVPQHWLPKLAELGFPIPTAKLLPEQPVEKESEEAEAPEAPAAASAQPPAEAGSAAVAPPAAGEAAHKGSELTGAWMLSQRERLGLSRNHLRRALGVEWRTVSRYETLDLPIPTPWRAKLAKLGFPVASSRSTPTKVDQAPETAPVAASTETPPSAATPPSATTPPSAMTPSLQTDESAPSAAPTTWFGRERERLELSRSKLRRVLGVPWDVIVQHESSELPIPAKWAPRLQELGFQLQPQTASPATQAAQEAAPATPSAPAQPSAAASLAGSRSGAEIIIEYWLLKARLTPGMSPGSALSRIIQELHESNLTEFLTLERIRESMQLLYR